VPLNLRWSLKSEKRQTLPVIDEILAEVVKIDVGKFILKSISILALDSKIRNYMSSAMSQPWYLFIKKSDKIYCSNDSGISLLSMAYRILSIIRSRLTPNAEIISGYHLCVIRGNRSTTVHT